MSGHDRRRRASRRRPADPPALRTALLALCALVTACAGDGAGSAADGAGPDGGGATDAVTLPDGAPETDTPGRADAPEDAPGDAPGDAEADAAPRPDIRPGDADAGGDTTPPLRPVFPHPAGPGWPAPNHWSWNGSWAPAPGDFPIRGLVDDEYDDGHTLRDGTVSPILPPGAWDWDDANDDLANWRSFAGSVGTFEELRDPQGRHFGWRLVGNTPEAVPFNGPAHYFEGTPGVDLLHLGPRGRINSDTEGTLGDGPDVLVFDEAWSLDFRTGETGAGGLPGGPHDDDLVVGGCTANAPAVYDIYGATIHTGPGADRIYVRDVRAAALDAGNGDGGITSVLDPLDGDDLVVLRGNMKDFRVFGGAGDDVVVWYVDEMGEDIAFAGPNFFGGGGAGDALWDTEGIDRLVLVVPPDTRVVSRPPTEPGDLMLSHYYGNLPDFSWDEPVYDDLYARYCVTCGAGPDGRRTLNMEYRPREGVAFTGWFWVTDFEELQLGIGPGAVVYRIDQAAATVTRAADLTPFAPPPWPDAWCEAPDDPGPGPGPRPGPGTGPGDTLYWPPEEAGWPPADAPIADPAALYPHAGAPGWPTPTVHAWDGSWAGPETIPFIGLFDDEYHDGHVIFDGTVTPILPPGEWDWVDANDDIANWRNFAASIGTFAPLLDADRRPFGWRLVPRTPHAVDYAAAAHYFEGTTGTDVLDLGPEGLLHSFTVGDLGDGPDVLVFDRAWSLDFRTGNALWGGANDNDLVIAGCTIDAGPAFDSEAASIHTGPGRDWIFARDFTGVAFDAGNGAGGDTSVLDPADGDDLVVIRGAARDFRVFGGAGDDVVVWDLDGNGAGDISFLGPNFFGGGGAGDALWDTEGTDRLVFLIPPDTPFVTGTPTPPGALLMRVWDGDDGTPTWDEPVYDDIYARYCVTCGVGPEGQRTIQFEYRKADDGVFTGWFWVTDFEELQLGVGPDARVFRIDQANARAIAAPDLDPFTPPSVPEGYCR